MKHHSDMPEEIPPSIPRDLHSEYEERPFRHCTRCGETLADDQGGFQISKAFKRGECVMEYALCDHCRVSMMEEFSQESKKRLADYQHGHVNLHRGLHHCSVCGVDRLTEEGAADYVITGLCEGSRLLHSIMVCGQCGDGIQELISAQTRDTWRRFVDENFPGPPGEGLEPEKDETPIVLPPAVLHPPH